MYFLIEDDNLLEKCNVVWDKGSTYIKKEFDGGTVYYKKFLKTKIACYCNVTVDFHNKEIPKAASDCTCLTVITIDSALQKEKRTIYRKCF